MNIIQILQSAAEYATLIPAAIMCILPVQHHCKVNKKVLLGWIVTGLAIASVVCGIIKIKFALHKQPKRRTKRAKGGKRHGKLVPVPLPIHLGIQTAGRRRTPQKAVKGIFKERIRNSRHRQYAHPNGHTGDIRQPEGQYNLPGQANESP